MTLLWRTIFPPVVLLCDGMIRWWSVEWLGSSAACPRGGMTLLDQSIAGQTTTPPTTPVADGQPTATHARSPATRPHPPRSIPSPPRTTLGPGPSVRSTPRRRGGQGERTTRRRAGAGEVGDWRLGAVGLAKPPRRLGRHAGPIEVHSIRSTDRSAPASNETAESGMRDGGWVRVCGRPWGA